MSHARPPSPTVISERPRHRRAPRLEVYVSSECLNCEESVRLASEVASRFPGVQVRVVDLDRLPDHELLPEAVVAVPTYLLDGRVISLGNPYLEELFARLSEAAG
jgi:alkyl hydroperoxide reductase subunit AhpF